MNNFEYRYNMPFLWFAKLSNKQNCCGEQAFGGVIKVCVLTEARCVHAGQYDGLNTAEQSMASVMSTALSRLNSFLDSELEQLLCFDTEIDAEKFCNEKSAIFIIIPEENPNTFFMISLIIQQLYREILAVADEHGGKLLNRCVFFCDEFGTLPKIESAEMMFSASRSRRLQIVPIIQSFSQLEKNYGKEGAEIIVDNT